MYKSSLRLISIQLFPFAIALFWNVSIVKCNKFHQIYLSWPCSYYIMTIWEWSMFFLDLSHNILARYCFYFLCCCDLEKFARKSEEGGSTRNSKYYHKKIFPRSCCSYLYPWNSLWSCIASRMFCRGYFPVFICRGKLNCIDAPDLQGRLRNNDQNKYINKVLLASYNVKELACIYQTYNKHTVPNISKPVLITYRGFCSLSGVVALNHLEKWCTVIYHL